MVAHKRTSLARLGAILVAGCLLGGFPAGTSIPPANAVPTLTAIAVSVSTVELAWPAPAGGAAGVRYRVRRNGQVVAALAGGTRSYADTTARPATDYRYTVEAVEPTGKVAFPLGTAEVQTPALPDTRDTEPPTAPEGLTATGYAGAVVLNWLEDGTDDSDVTACRIYRNGRLLATVKPGTLRYVDYTVQPGRLYTYALEALDVVGHHSPPSDAATTETPTGPAAAPPPLPPPPSARVAPRAPANYSAQLRRYPYLTDVVGPYATINWATDRSGSGGTVTWGRAGAESCTAHSAVATRASITVGTSADYQWTAPLTLTGDTAYCYRVFLDGVDLLAADPAPRFLTQVAAGATAPYSFAVFGDWGATDSSGANPDQANLMAQIATSGARFALTVGDNSYPSGSQSNYGDLVETGANISGVFGPSFWAQAGASIPLFPVMGNHGLSRSDALHPHLLNWPQTRAVATSNGRYAVEPYCCLNGTNAGNYPSTWYAFDAGTARFYVLQAAWPDGNVGSADVYQNDHDYHWAPGSAEYQWLAQDLATHPRALKFAFFHYPIYSDNSHQSSDTFLQGATGLEGLLSHNGVNIGFTGHAHLYQHNHPAGPASLITYISGGGGGTLETIGDHGCSALDDYGTGWSYSSNHGSICGGAGRPTDLGQVFHFLLVQVNGTQVTVSPVDEFGNRFDSTTYQFGGPLPTSTPAASATRTPPPAASATPTATQGPALTATRTRTAAPATATRTAPSGATATPPGLTPTVPACDVCGAYVSAVDESCNADGSVHWRATLRNNGACTITSGWTANLQVQSNWGAYTTVETSTGLPASFPPGDTTLSGNLPRYAFPANTTAVQVDFALTLTGNCAVVAGVSGGMAPCP